MGAEDSPVSSPIPKATSKTAMCQPRVNSNVDMKLTRVMCQPRRTIAPSEPKFCDEQPPPTRLSHISSNLIPPTLQSYLLCQPRRISNPSGQSSYDEEARQLSTKALGNVVAHACHYCRAPHASWSVLERGLLQRQKFRP